MIYIYMCVICKHVSSLRRTMTLRSMQFQIPPRPTQPLCYSGISVLPRHLAQGMPAVGSGCGPCLASHTGLWNVAVPF